MQKSLFFISFLFLILVSCKSKDETYNEAKQDVQSSESLADEGYRLITSENATPDQISQWVSSATSILNHRIENDEQTTWAIMDEGVWEYEFIFEKGEMSKEGEYAGHWIDFDSDHTYTYGYYDEQKGSGKYHYSPNTELLLMVNNNPKIKPIEYKVKMANDVMVFSGSPEYLDNGKQGKLQRRGAVPVKE